MCEFDFRQAQSGDLARPPDWQDHEKQRRPGMRGADGQSAVQQQLEKPTPEEALCSR
jgi:hypothetical protein